MMAKVKQSSSGFQDKKYATEHQADITTSHSSVVTNVIFSD